MSQQSSSERERWEELHVTRLLFGLTAEEKAEYDRVASQIPAQELEQLDKVVASLDLMWSNQPSEPLPETLRREIRMRAAQELAKNPVESFAKPSLFPAPSLLGNSTLPWLVAACCAFLALFAWMANRPSVGRRPDLAQLRAELISSNEGIVQAKWSPGPTPSEGATGDIVWSATQQKGFMRFRGLPVNTPTREQYQLWIFAKNQSDKTPIDGGVFDITSTSETIVPINAKLLVEDAYMFAVTIEKPGGVVVSSRKRLPLLAKVD